MQKKVREDSGFKRKKWRDTDKEVSQAVFHTVKRPDEVPKKSMLRDRMAGIRISDSKPLALTDLVLCQKIDERPDGVVKSLPIYRECLKPGTFIEFDLTIDTRLYDTNDSFIKAYVQRFFESYERIYLTKYPDKPMKGNSMLVLGGGAGYPTKSVMYSLMEEQEAVRLLKDFFLETTPREHKHTEDVRTYHISPHTRRRTKYNGLLYDMGVCVMDIQEK